ncbi:unnamed protein product, partial [Darwinula stevensoni]
MNLEDEPRSGCPSEIDDEQLQHTVEADPRQSTRDFVTALGCAQSTIVMHLAAIGKKSKLGQWLPHDPTDCNHEHRAEPCQEMDIFGEMESFSSVEEVPVHQVALIFIRVVEAGQYCTFLIHGDGTVSACGKGSYGRLGLGDSHNQAVPKALTFELPNPGSALLAVRIIKVSSSKGSDGHTLALTSDGQVFSWGDGDYGKLGHGNGITQKYPKLLEGPLKGKMVTGISAGYRHSACVTADGDLYTWGEGDYGRLGLGDNSTRTLPTLVNELSGGAGQVFCGSAHTFVLSQDGCCVWAFGSGEHGRLGFGQTSCMRVRQPRLIDALQGLGIQKLACAAQATLAITSAGQVLSWGSGPCLGAGCPEVTWLQPTPISSLTPLTIVDICCGDSHCLALTRDSQVYAWGNNSMGQCGLGHSSSPVCIPAKVGGLEGVPIHQISAGTSHSIAWTTVPLDRQVVSWQRAFSIDLHSQTFSTLYKFLETFAANLEQHPLNMQNLIDKCVEPQIQEEVRHVIQDGASFLLPSTEECVAMVHSILCDGRRGGQLKVLSSGKSLMLQLLVQKLQEPQEASAVLSHICKNTRSERIPPESKDAHGFHAVDVVERMKGPSKEGDQQPYSLLCTLLTTSYFNLTLKVTSFVKREANEDAAEYEDELEDIHKMLEDLLDTLFFHFLAQLVSKQNPRMVSSSEADAFKKHLSLLIKFSCQMFSTCETAVNVLTQDAIAELEELTLLVCKTNTLCQALRSKGFLQSGQKNSCGPAEENHSWEWLEDILLSGSLLCGKTHHFLLSGSQSEKTTSIEPIQNSPLLSNGLDLPVPQLG